MQGGAGLLLSVALFAVSPAAAVSQDRVPVTDEALAEVFPDAERFGPRQGDPPVFEAFATDPREGSERLVGYAFLTSDLPPEVYGYNAPIDVLVGMNLQGELTGVAVMGYRESLRRSRGDFLDRSSFLREFVGKHVSEPFRVRTDIDGISGATITVDAMSRGVRNAARRVAVAYLNPNAPDASETYIATTELDAIEGMLWAEILDRGLAAQVFLEEGSVQMTLSMIYLRDPALGEMLVGPSTFQEGLTELESRGVRPDPEAEDSGRLMLMGLSGEDSFFFRASALRLVQEGDTLAVPGENIEMFPLLSEGKLQGEVRRSALVVVDPALDLARPFEIVLDFRPRGEVASGAYTVMPPATATVARADEAPDASAAPGDTEPETRAGDTIAATAVTGDDAAAPDPADDGAGADPPELAGARANASPPPADPPGPPETSAAELDFEALLAQEAEAAEETAFSRVLARTSWTRVAGFVLLLVLASVAFAAKGAPWIRWGTLGVTLLVLGFYDGGFLSVSHIIAGISAGPSVYLTDLPLLLLVGFTVVTTVLWGRVFCGFLCPFGALQDVLERIVPERFRRELPAAVHDRALYVKYGILAIVLVPPILGSGLSLFQYFEPFGTVFYRSTSLVLWAIAGLFLIGSAVVPRFYCRYACPLGAALAVGSLASPFRIRRVEQCGLCKVCEQKCPTGAIRGPDIDFKECVRCNTCEIQLIEKNGVCAHDMERIRPRLVKLPVAGAAPVTRRPSDLPASP